MPAKSPRFSFLLKIGVTIALVAAFDWLFPQFPQGVCVGLFALAWLLGLILARPGTRRPRIDIASALALAAVLCIALAYDPGPLAWVLFWSALSLAALLPRMAGFDDAWRWLLRLGLHGVSGVVTPLNDAAHMGTLRPRGKRLTLRSLAALLGLPLIGTAIFVVLFANANPLIANLLDQIQLPELSEMLTWVGVILLVWPAFRPARFVTRLRLPEPRVALPGSSLASVLIALTLFNLLFAIQNGLDIAFLWSGAPLPAGMSMTEYVHRGAYPLIATALLAGLFVLTMLRPGTPTAASKPARRLVALWVAQNVFLVASSALRTIRYIEDYELTTWRIAALLWMGLVAAGLILICWRMWFDRSARWLINANALATALVLIPCCFIDLDASAARWNVEHAREVGGTGQPIDLCYLNSLGDASLLPIVELARRPVSANLRDQLYYLRETHLDALVERQAHWQSWTPHGALRLAKARSILGFSTSAPLPADGTREPCGALVQPAISAPPLTGAPAQ